MREDTPVKLTANTANMQLLTGAPGKIGLGEDATEGMQIESDSEQQHTEPDPQGDCEQSGDDSDIEILEEMMSHSRPGRGWRRDVAMGARGGRGGFGRGCARGMMGPRGGIGHCGLGMGLRGGMGKRGMGPRGGMGHHVIGMGPRAGIGHCGFGMGQRGGMGHSRPGFGEGPAWGMGGPPGCSQQGGMPPKVLRRLGRLAAQTGESSSSSESESDTNGREDKNGTETKNEKNEMHKCEKGRHRRMKHRARLMGMGLAPMVMVHGPRGRMGCVPRGPPGGMAWVAGHHGLPTPGRPGVPPHLLHRLRRLVATMEQDEHQDKKTTEKENAKENNDPQDNQHEQSCQARRQDRLQRRIESLDSGSEGEDPGPHYWHRRAMHDHHGHYGQHGHHGHHFHLGQGHFPLRRLLKKLLEAEKKQRPASQEPQVDCDTDTQKEDIGDSGPLKDWTELRQDVETLDSAVEALPVEAITGEAVLSSRTGTT